MAVVMELTASNQMSKLSSLEDDYTAVQLKTIFENNQNSQINNIINNYNHSDILSSIFNYGMFSDDNYVFKNSNKFNFYKNLFDNLKIDKINIDVQFLPKSLVYKILSVLVSIDKGQYILYKLPYKEMFNFLDENNKKELYFNSGVSGTLPTFLLIEKLMDEKNYIDLYHKSILSAVSRNADDRLLKHVINNFESYNFPKYDNPQFIICVINQIFSPHIPQKYILRRLKKINTKINLKPFFPHMLRVVNDVSLFEKIYKYYHNNDSLIVDYNINLSSIIGFTDDGTLDSKIERILNTLDNKYDKYIFLIQSYIDFYDMGDDYIDLSKYYHEEFSNSDVVQKFHIRLVSSIITQETNKIFGGNFSKNFNCVFSNINVNEFHTKYSNAPVNKLNALIFFLPFVPYYFRNEKIIKLNLVKHQIKLWLRKRNKMVKIMKRIENFNFKEENLTPFSKVPPRHSVPFELESISETDSGYYMISEKADGCLVDFIPTTVEPLIESYTSVNVKAEFIEDLDLYLIFDYNVDMNILDRYDSLRRSHPVTKDDKSIRQRVVHDYEDLKTAIAYERKMFEEFLKIPYKNYRVYPKASWLVTDPTKFNRELVENIIEEKDSKFVCNEGSYENDGFIITPLDGTREIKLKPKSLHTIDLLYNNGWKDREGNSWNHIIKYDNKPRNNIIMRCYPLFIKNDNSWLFEPREIRLDKNKPNTYKIIKMIYGLHSINWNKLYEGANSYYSDSKIEKSKSWQDVVNKQNNHLKSLISNISIEPRSSWLDLGCGSGRFIRYLKDSMIKSYVGIDYDMKQLIKGTHMTDKNFFMSKNCRFIHCNLENEWSSSETSIDFLDENEKFEYIISNHSLAHFYNENFWSKLDGVSETGCTFIFNVVNTNIETRWISGKDYMMKDENLIKYKFTSVHTDEMTERFIDDKEITDNLEKHNWVIISKHIPDGNDLDSKYTWYVVKKT